MTRRTGIPKILASCQELQGDIAAYSPTISSIHPTNADLIQALADLAICLVPIIKELSAVRELGD